MLDINKNLTSDEAKSLVAGQDTNLSNGMPWDIIDEKMEIMFMAVKQQAEEIGRLKAEKRCLTEQMCLVTSLKCRSGSKSCEFEMFIKMVERTNGINLHQG